MYREKVTEKCTEKRLQRNVQRKGYREMYREKVTEKCKSKVNKFRKGLQSQSPGKHQKLKKTVNDFDNFNRDVRRRTVFDMCGVGEFPTAENLYLKRYEDAVFNRSATSAIRNLKSVI
jgi:hypothetical protein